jgi:hypothetical protein
VFSAKAVSTITICFGYLGRFACEVIKGNNVNQSKWHEKITFIDLELLHCRVYKLPWRK